MKEPVSIGDEAFVYYVAYTLDGEGEYGGSELMDEGIDVSFDETFTARFIKILKK
jgi:hypothetical protein